MTLPPDDRDTALTPLYLRSLIRVHRDISLTFLGGFALLAVGLPVVFWWFPAVAGLTILGVPLAWWVLGVVGYPLLVAAGWLYVRAVEAAEAEFTDLVEGG